MGRNDASSCLFSIADKILEPKPLVSPTEPAEPEGTCAGQLGRGGNLHVSAVLSAARLVTPLSVANVLDVGDCASNLS